MAEDIRAAIAIGLSQVLFYIRTPKQALGDFLDPCSGAFSARWSWG
jgi:hypothetical protein